VTPRGETEFSKADLQEGLGAAGATVEDDGPIEHAFFSVSGSVLRVNGVDVQVSSTRVLRLAKPNPARSLLMDRRSAPG
jgi:hypothetical protein